MEMANETRKLFPVAGPREPVYALLRHLGFSMSNLSDKHWSSHDGIEIQIYGAGSMAQIYLQDQKATECELDNLADQIDVIRRKQG